MAGTRHRALLLPLRRRRNRLPVCLFPESGVQLGGWRLLWELSRVLVLSKIPKRRSVLFGAAVWNLGGEFFYFYSAG